MGSIRLKFLQDYIEQNSRAAMYGVAGAGYQSSFYDPNKFVRVFVSSNGDYTQTVDRSTQTIFAGSGGSRADQYSIKVDYSDNTVGVNATGGRFGDVLRSGSGNDALNGGAGNDVLEGGAGADAFDGGDGSDTVSYEHSTIGVRVDLDNPSVGSNDAAGDTFNSIENIRGSDAMDQSMGQFSDFILGNSIRNIIEGGKGQDFIDGRGGGDVASYQHSVEAVTVNLTTGVHTGGDAQGDALLNIRDLLGSANDDSLTGDFQDNILDGGAGADTLTGLTGNDTYFVDNVGDVVVEADGQGNDIIQSSISYALTDTQFIETLRLVNATGNADLDLTGNSFANRLIGNAGDNVLDGGGGADRLEGGRGDDTYYVDDAGDVVIEFAGGGNDTVLVDTDLLSYALQETRNVETLRAEDLTAVTALKLYGNGFANTLIGNAGNNVLNSRGGGDTLEGRSGDDIYYVTGDDTVVEAAGADGGNDSLIALTSFTLDEGAAVETLRLVSTLGNGSTLVGNEFDQRLVGNANANTLNGGLGNDILQGGAGSDSFLFSTALGADNIDTIRDFNAGQDQILLSQRIFANVTTDETGRLSADEFVDIGVAGNTVDGDDSIAYNSETGALFYVTQGSDGPELQQFAVLTTRPTLTASDFGVPFTE